ncbi:MAG: hypothetical protein H0T89_02965 [Deltaproteobacteria bacterium]|nr:hypothetical protein [Deltaproteobacteria bacterium]
MKTSFLATTLVSTLGLFTACGGGSDLDSGAGDSGGTGTNTLLVNGSVSADPRLTNARAAAEFDTEFSLRIMLNGVGVTTGTVTITGNSGEFPLTYVGDNGQWEGRGLGYDEVYILDVISGEHEVTGVRVDGPDFHTFEEPLAGATVDSTLPLKVTWDSGESADSTAIRADNIDWVSIPDEQTYMLAAGSLDANQDQATTNELRLVRTNRVIPAGGVGGSEFSVSIENRIDVVAQPNPAL